MSSRQENVIHEDSEYTAGGIPITDHQKRIAEPDQATATIHYRAADAFYPQFQAYFPQFQAYF